MSAKNWEPSAVISAMSSAVPNDWLTRWTSVLKALPNAVRLPGNDDSPPVISGVSDTPMPAATRHSPTITSWNGMSVLSRARSSSPNPHSAIPMVAGHRDPTRS